jgi:hypothetical protein
MEGGSVRERKHTESHIIVILKEAEAGVKVSARAAD